MLVHCDKPSSSSEIKEALEGNDPVAKVAAMKKAVMMLLNGEQLPQLFITIVRYVLPSEDHTVQKLLLLYLEAIEKTDSNGKLLPEMVGCLTGYQPSQSAEPAVHLKIMAHCVSQILICQNLRNNLQHPNEYIRGVTLRFLCRIREEEILEPLVPSILANLEHRHSYVRRNAVLAVNAIYKLPKGELLLQVGVQPGPYLHEFPLGQRHLIAPHNYVPSMLQDAPETIEKVMGTEQDLSTRRNAFVMLASHAQDRAVRYLMEHVEQVSSWGDILQMGVLELIRKVCRTSPAEKGKHIKIILALLQSTSTAVVYECAVTLVSLSQAPSAVRAAANCYCQLLVSQSDNNVKLIVLDRLMELKNKHREVMQEVLMDILRALTSPNMDICKKTLDIAMDIITSRNIDEVVMVLKKEIMKTQNKDFEKGGEYRQMLVQAIHGCAVKFPDVAANVVHLLMDFLGDANTASALEVVFFVREIMETNAKLRVSILERLRDTLYQIRSSRVCSTALWILGEYSATEQEIESGVEVVKQALGPTPFLTAEGEEAAAAAAAAAPLVVVPAVKRPTVLADGTYATQAAVEVVPSAAAALINPNTPNLRSLLLGGDFFLGGVIAGTLTKLLLRLRALGTASAASLNKATAEAMLIIVSILRLSDSASLPVPLDDDSRDRMLVCLSVLAKPDEEAVQVRRLKPSGMWLSVLR
ncbi:hypothetical protein QJQ45_030541 [Haematococcus lacustris]|nr:hypothetical protein QJQ45_030541 [Haematococcus lacustris]